MEFKWERIYGDSHSSSKTFRAKVFGGWIVRSITIDYDFGKEYSSTFIPDKDHEWVITEDTGDQEDTAKQHIELTKVS